MPECRRTKRVLIVDDEQVIADTLAMILERSGFEARTAYSGEQAVELAREFGPDVLITDVVMHGMTGIEAAIEVLAFAPICKVILFSGQATTLNLMSNAQQTSHNFEILTKPVQPQTLLDRLGKLA